MAIVTPGGQQVSQLPNDYDIAGFSFHGLDNPVTMVDEEGIAAMVVNAYAVIEVIGSYVDGDTVTPVSRQAIRIAGDAYMATVTQYPALYRLLALAMYEALQAQGFVPSGTVPISDEDKAVIAAYGAALVTQYGGIE